MSKILVALTALLAVTAGSNFADAQSTSDYLPMVNPGASKCIVKGTFNKEKSQYALKLDSCTHKNVAKLRHVGKGKELRTSDKYCLTPINTSGKADVELVLRKCPSKVEAKGLKWTKVGKNQWQSGDKLCMEYVSKSKKFMTKKCATLASDDKKSYQQFKFQEPPKIKCADWGKKWRCGAGWTLNTKSGLTCVGATDASCANVCCMPVKTCKNQGYTKCPADYKFVDRQCGNPGQKACSYNNGVCCDYAPKNIKCSAWNKCSSQFALKPRAKDIWCTTGTPVQGPGYAPKCSDSICCDKTMEQTTCGKWNKCDANYEIKPNSYNKRCWVKLNQKGIETYHHNGGNSAGSEWCSTNACCARKATPPTPPAPVNPIDCGKWSGKCDANNGWALNSKAKDILCHANPANVVPGPSYAPACNAEVCCVQDTCEQWSEREQTFKGDMDFAVDMTGKEYCQFDSTKYSGLMDKNDPRFTEKCTDANGRNVVCKPDMCCVSV